MRYLFSKNKASDINDAGEKLQKAIRMYHNKVLIPHDTMFLENISLLVYNILFVMLMLLKIFTPGEKGVMFLVGVIGIAIIDGLFGFMVFGSRQPDYGYIGTSLNNKISRKNPELAEAESQLGQICDRLKVIEEMVAISNDVEKLHERYGDDLTINISGLPDNYCDVTFTCCIERNIGKQLTYTDKISKNYRMNRSFAANIFTGDTVDFSWLDGEMEGVKEDLCREILTISDNKNSAKILEDKSFKKIVGRITMKPYNDKNIKTEFDKSSPRKFSLEDKNDGLDCYRHEYNEIIADHISSRQR